MTGLFSGIRLHDIDLSNNKLISEENFWNCIHDLRILGYLHPKPTGKVQAPTQVFLNLNRRCYNAPK